LRVAKVKPLAANTKRVLAIAHAEADDEGYRETAAHHVLLALLQERTGVTALVVDALGLDAALVRGLVAEMSGMPSGDEDEGLG
jgi:ATP-dependent Clp protease ATP-binding subunit ClpA